MRQDLPDVVKVAERLMAEVHLAVRRFNRANRNDYGAELRRQAINLVSFALRAWWDVPNQARRADELIGKVDDFNAYLRLGKQLQAFASFAQFEALSRTACELGRQVGGWRKKLHLKGQNPAAQRTAPPERATTLSSRAASNEANA